MNSLRRNRLIIVFVIIAISVCSGRESFAGMPGFDCSKATTKIEKCICDDQNLSLDDNIMAFRYRQLIKFLPEDEKESFKQEQRKWLAMRNRKCGGLRGLEENKKCLKALYPPRIDALNKLWDNLEPPENFKPDYPDVWGVNLPLHGYRHNISEPIVSLYTNKFHEVYLYYGYFIQGCEKTEKLYVWRLYDFFRKKIVVGEDEPCSQDLNYQFYKKLQIEEYAKEVKIADVDHLFLLSDESEIFKKGLILKEKRSSGGNCVDPITNWLSLYNKSRLLYEKTILFVSDTGFRAQRGKDCERGGGKFEQLFKVMSLYPKIWRLADDTILLNGSKTQIVIRFNSKFESKFATKINGVFVLDKDYIFNAYDKFVDEAVSIDQGRLKIDDETYDKETGSLLLINESMSFWEYATKKLYDHLMKE